MPGILPLDETGPVPPHPRERDSEEVGALGGRGRRQTDPREVSAFTVGRLVQDLRAHGFDAAAEPTGVLITGSDAQLWDPPVRLTLSDAELQGWVARPPGRLVSMHESEPSPPLAYRELLVELGEQLISEAMDGAEIALVDGRLETRPSQWEAIVREHGPLEFLSPEQYRARYGVEPVPPPERVNPFTAEA